MTTIDMADKTGLRNVEEDEGAFAAVASAAAAAVASDDGNGVDDADCDDSMKAREFSAAVSSSDVDVGASEETAAAAAVEMKARAFHASADDDADAAAAAKASAAACTSAAAYSASEARRQSGGEDDDEEQEESENDIVAGVDEGVIVGDDVVATTTATRAPDPTALPAAPPSSSSSNARAPSFRATRPGAVHVRGPSAASMSAVGGMGVVGVPPPPSSGLRRGTNVGAVGADPAAWRGGASAVPGLPPPPPLVSSHHDMMDEEEDEDDDESLGGGGGRGASEDRRRTLSLSLSSAPEHEHAEHDADVTTVATVGQAWTVPATPNSTAHRRSNGSREGGGLTTDANVSSASTLGAAAAPLDAVVSSASTTRRATAKLAERKRRKRCHMIASMAAAAILGLGLGLGIGLSVGRRGNKGGQEGNADADASQQQQEEDDNLDGSNNASFVDPSSRPRWMAFRDVIYSNDGDDGGDEDRGEEGQNDFPAYLDNPRSPQRRALAWLAGVDTANLDPASTDDDISTQRRLRQRHALATFYYATGGDSKDGWIDECHFLTGEHECDWNNGRGGLGAFCNDGESEGGATIAVLDLRTNGLDGTIPDEIGRLTDMTKLVLVMNDLHGTIPQSVGKLTSLKFVNLHRNDLTGTVPSELSLLRDLEGLWLGVNHLTGTLPDMRKSVFIKALDYSQNMMKNFPDWVGTDLTQMEYISIQNNLITGTIPPSIARLPNLDQIYFHQNMWDDEFLPGLSPSDFNDRASYVPYPSLRTIVCWKCNLNGTVPSGIGRLPKLELLTLSLNDLRGTLPSTLSNLTLLKGINFEGNRLTGSIPPSTSGGGSNGGALRSVHMGRNRFDGPFPYEFVSLNPQLYILTLEGNKFTGTLPQEWGEDTRDSTSNLWMLNLASNELTGTIPSMLGRATELRYLDLGDNRLNGTVPKELKGLDKLDWFSVSKNDLTGSMDFFCSAGEDEGSKANRTNIFGGGSGRSSTTPQLYADCGGPAPEVNCPCCAICCSDDDDNGGGGGECQQPPLPTFTVVTNLCIKTLLPTMAGRAENYSDLICTPETLREQLVLQERSKQQQGDADGPSRRGLLRGSDEQQVVGNNGNELPLLQQQVQNPDLLPR